MSLKQLHEETILKKVKKLLALAGNNPNEHERLRASEAAHDLLAKHNLTLAQVKDSLDGPGEYLCDTIKINEEWIKYVLHAATKLYFTSWFMRSKKGAQHPILIGTAENVGVTVEVTKWLIKMMRKEAKLRYPEGCIIQKRSFLLGAAEVLAARAIVRLEEERQNRQGTTTGSSLILVSNNLEKANQEYKESLNIEKGKLGEQKIDKEHWRSGVVYGKQIPLQRQVTKRDE